MSELVAGPPFRGDFADHRQGHATGRIYGVFRAKRRPLVVFGLAGTPFDDLQAQFVLRTEKIFSAESRHGEELKQAKGRKRWADPRRRDAMAPNRSRNPCLHRVMWHAVV